LGHAGAMRACGFRPSIKLYGMGGLTSYNQSQFAAGVRLRPLDQIAIALAGPVAGFVLAGVVCGGMFLSGHRPDVHVGLPYGIDIGPAEMIGSPPLTWLIGDVLFISVFWGLVNLLPVYPLDGGQIAREVLLWLNPREGIGQSLLLSTVVATLLAVCGLVLWRSYLTAFFFGYLAFQSYATLHAYNGRRGPW
jgi:Zn-dependent protease